MGKLMTQLTDAINELGNDLTGAGWPAGEKNGRKFDTSMTFKKLVIDASGVAWLEGDLRDCVNELCLRCGSYKEEHLGACNGCRWKEVRHGG